MTVSVNSSMVVAQGGARATRDVLGSLEDHVITVTQKERETLSQLALRVRRAVEYLKGRRMVLCNAVFVARPGFDLEDVPATADLVRSVVAHMVSAGRGEVHLQAANTDPRSRYALTALADAVSEQVRGTGVHVITRDPEPSQTIVLSEVRRAASA